MLAPAELKRRLCESGICKPAEIRGCSDKQLERIEKKIGRHLPKSYKQFMLAIGRGAGEFMSDLTIFYPSVLTCTDTMRQMLAEYGTTLPEDAFVFIQRYGQQLLFFHLSNRNDPPIFYWSDDDPGLFERAFDSIWGFVESELVAHEEIVSDTANRDAKKDRAARTRKK